ncbi:hypothetical protein LTR37_011211 [Vermiconidia calcicola]|uniref:Uncharacterized protein n=1 Tax=Vermiconidia calcicola TaxID=1690605 RepID=A0ACC3N2P5_9PEZI|nr:hypothetical protein LTR37_011211 [Vermiconidia calcicola]
MASSKAGLNTNPGAQRIVATNEKVTGPPAAEMLRQSGIDQTPSSESLELMDNACGGGILTSEFVKLAAEHDVPVKRILASDHDENMVSYTARRKEDSAWESVEVKQIDQQSVPLPAGSFSHVFNNFGVFFCPNDEAALSETYRILKPNGTAGFTSWKTIAWWPAIAMPAIDAFIPDAPKLPSPGTVFPVRGWSDPAATSGKLENAGFRDVQVSEYAFTPDAGAEDFAEATAVLVKVVTKRFWSEEENQKHGDQIEPALLRYLKENFSNGKWNGQMVALIALGNK